MTLEVAYHTNLKIERTFRSKGREASEERVGDQMGAVPVHAPFPKGKTYPEAK